MNEKRQNRRQSWILPAIFTGISLLGLLVLLAIVFGKTSKGVPANSQLIGAAFAAVCFMGVMAAVSPSQCSRGLHRQKHRTRINNSETATASEPVEFRGHHANCGRFHSHVFNFHEKAYCAGCMGLATGAIVSIVGTSLYSFVGVELAEAGKLIIWPGLAGVVLGLFQYQVPVKRASVHFFVNVVFVVGAFLILVGVSETDGSLFSELYVLGLIIYLITTRIVLSRWEHDKTCTACEAKSCRIRPDY